MKHVIFKIIAAVITFTVTLIVFGNYMNRGNVNTTKSMDKATLPVVYMSIGGEYVNELHGYRQEMTEALLRENITPLDESRGLSFRVVKYGQLISAIEVNVRTVTGDRLIEKIEASDYTEDDYGINISITLKDLLEDYTEYSLEICLELTDGSTANYYTRIIKADNYCTKEKLAFVENFLEKESSTDTNAELSEYMESNYLGDNSTLSTVTIHSSMKQLAFGDLKVKRISEPVISIKEIASETGVFLADYIMQSEEEGNQKLYRVQEYYRIKYSSEVTYLLDYKRTMEEFPVEDTSSVGSESLYLGMINTDNTYMIESDDGNVIAYTQTGRLYSYNISSNRLVNLFSFYDEDDFDARTYRNMMSVKPLSVDEAGNIWFVVSGYMSRGTYEGKVGIALYYYNGVTGIVDEKFFIESTKPWEMVVNNLEKLSFMSKDGIFFFMLDSAIYAVDTADSTCETVVTDLEENSYTISDSSTMMVWINGNDVNASESLTIMNLNTKQLSEISAPSGQYIKPLAFMGEDLVYGLAYKSDVVTDDTGRTTFPMYTVRIQNKFGEQLKEYSNDGIYVTRIDVNDNLITLYRAQKSDSSVLLYKEIESDYISNNQTQEEMQNVLDTYTNGVYESVARIILDQANSGQAVLVIPQQVIYEGTKILDIEEPETGLKYYFTYYGGKLQNIYTNPANAVTDANNNYGTVLNEHGKYVWYRANRSQRNQIMDLTLDAAEDEEESSLVFCLDNMLQYAGVVRNSEYLLDHGETVLDILNDALENCDVLDLTGTELDAVLYYVNRDIPVLALMNSGDAYLLIGYNSLSVVVCEPKKGSYKIGINEAQKLFEENGNQFITYVPND